MWLINTSTHQLTEALGPIPPFAILSHRWYAHKHEVSFKEFRKGLKIHTPGLKKIVQFCALAEENGFEWGWVDTCCIDKRSSAELSEAINSMYSWYEQAQVCYAFLGDVQSADWKKSDWWHRGWTLQELVAPRTVIFFDRDWKEISNKKSMANGIENISGIPVAILRHDKPLTAWTVAQKMAWAAHRETTRIEDQAYSLLGLFKINMPMLYGEGKNAFQRLQIKILQKYPDESIFAWRDGVHHSKSVLAESPHNFRQCLDMKPNDELQTYQDPDPRRENPPRATSWGIELRANARKLMPTRPVFIDGKPQSFLWAVTLTVALSGRIQELPCTIVLARYGPAPYSYLRNECHTGGLLEVLRRLEDIYMIGPLEEGILFYLWFDQDICF